MKRAVQEFRMPRYREIPDVGLYLEQVTRYINGFLQPVGFGEVTPSMVSNYVKQGHIPNPIKKQYYAEHIAALLFLCVVKRVLSMENTSKLMALLRQLGTPPEAYDIYCQQLEDGLKSVFGCGPQPAPPETEEEARLLLHSTVLAVAHIIYLNARLSAQQEQEKNIG